MRKALLSLLTLVFGISVSAQEYTHFNSIDSIYKAIELHDQGEYERALQLFESVHPGDSNYTYARYEAINTLLALSRYDSVIDLSNEFLKESYGEHDGTYTILGSAYDMSGNPDKAIETYQQGIEKYPMNANLYFNLGVTYYNQEDFENATKAYMEALKRDLYHASSNLYLGMLCADEKEYAMALYCFQMFLIIEPSSRRSLEVLGMANNIAKMTFESNSKGISMSKITGDDFKKENLLLKSQAALKKDYKIPGKINLPYSKQCYMLAEQIKTIKGNGFFSEYYLPFYKELFAQEKYIDLIYYSMVSTTNDDLIKLLEKNSKAISDFPDYAAGLWVNSHTGYSENINGQSTFINYEYNGSRVTGKGESSGGEAEGEWTFYLSNGSVGSIGTIEKGEKVGIWRYFFSTLDPSGSEFYKNGKLEGNDTAYYVHGDYKYINNYKDGKLNGLCTSFHEYGGIDNELNLEEGKTNGSAKYFYSVGTPKYELNYDEGKINGEFKRFYDDGAIYELSTFVNDQRDGKTTYYYRDGSVMEEQVHADGSLNGPYTTYYNSGEVEQKGTYQNDIVVGEYTEYYRNGQIESQGNKDENGEDEGVYTEYDSDGGKSLELTYKKGEIIAYTSYDSSGKVLKNAKKSGGEFYFESYFPNGNRQTQGNYLVGDGGKDGKWTFYNRNGSIDSEQEYSEGSLNGKITNYYLGGGASEVILYEDGSKEGPYVSYSEYGQIDILGWYSNGEKNGDWFYYDHNGTITKHLFFVNGEENGPQVYYSVNGKIDFIDEYKMGSRYQYIAYDTNETEMGRVLFTSGDHEYTIKNINGNKLRTFNMRNKIFHGLSTNFYNNGQISSTGSYLNGKKTGEWKYYYRNGQLSKKGEFLNGNKVGKWLQYFEDGSSFKEINYDIEGNYHGDYKEYSEQGGISYETSYVHGVKTEARYSSEEGDLQQVRYYKDGDIVSYSHPGADGKLVTPIEVQNETGELKSYFADGKPSRILTFNNGLINGEFLSYYPNGQLEQKLIFKEGEYHGTMEVYYSNGNLKSSTEYFMGDKHGVEKVYYKNGKIRFEKNYRSDSLHGTSTYYNENGQKTKTENYYESTLIE